MNERKNELQAADRMALEDILILPPASLKPDQLAHLRARRAYLTDEEIKRFGLDSQEEGKAARRGKMKKDESE